jgi:hypothetical protein
MVREGSTETNLESEKPLLAGLSATIEENSLKPGMVGWGGRIRTSVQLDDNLLKRRAIHVPLLRR